MEIVCVRHTLPLWGNCNRKLGDIRMPIVEISLIEGRSLEKKAELIKEVTNAVQKVLGSRPMDIRVVLRDIPKGNLGVGGEIFPPVSQEKG